MEDRRGARRRGGGGWPALPAASGGCGKNVRGIFHPAAVLYWVPSIRQQPL